MKKNQPQPFQAPTSKVAISTDNPGRMHGLAFTGRTTTVSTRNEDAGNVSILPRDDIKLTEVVQALLQEVKTNGAFDEIRKACLGVSDKPEYKSLQNRALDQASKFVKSLQWTPDFDAGKGRDKLRGLIMGNQYYKKGLDCIINRSIEEEMSLIRSVVTTAVENHLNPPNTEDEKNIEPDPESGEEEEEQPALQEGHFLVESDEESPMFEPIGQDSPPLLMDQAINFFGLTPPPPDDGVPSSAPAFVEETGPGESDGFVAEVEVPHLIEPDSGIEHLEVEKSGCAFLEPSVSIENRRNQLEAKVKELDELFNLLTNQSSGNMLCDDEGKGCDLQDATKKRNLAHGTGIGVDA